MADDQSPDAGLGERVDRLETGQDMLSQKIDQILGIVSGRAPSGSGEEQPGGRPDIEHQVRAELARAEKEKADQQAAEDEKSEREQLRERLAALTETAPVPPQRRAERVMWGRA